MNMVAKEAEMNSWTPSALTQQSSVVEGHMSSLAVNASESVLPER